MRETKEENIEIFNFTTCKVPADRAPILIAL
jgi:hypothetical protein